MKFFTNLEDVLLKENKRKVSQSELEDQEVSNLLQANDEAYTMSVLSSIGMSKKYGQMVDASSRKSRTTGLDKSRIVGLDAIERMCVKYHLRFLPTRLYRGSIDPKAIREISKFTEARSNSRDRFMIAAPEDQFELQKQPVDPILFYELDSNHYYIVAKWGRDINVLRAITMWPFRDRLTITVTLLCVIVGILSVGWHYGPTSWGWLTRSMSIVFSIVLGFINFGLVTDDSFARDILAKHNWNREFK